MAKAVPVSPVWAPVRSAQAVPPIAAMAVVGGHHVVSAPAPRVAVQVPAPIVMPLSPAPSRAAPGPPAQGAPVSLPGPPCGGGAAPLSGRGPHPHAPPVAGGTAMYMAEPVAASSAAQLAAAGGHHHQANPVHLRHAAPGSHGAVAMPVGAVPVGAMPPPPTAQPGWTGPMPGMTAPGSPYANGLGADFRERRPTDPFFYPTTVNPLTGLGISLIEQTTPPLRRTREHAVGSPGMPHGVPTKREEPPPPPLFVGLPIHGFMEWPEGTNDMKQLVEQNESLSRHMQALEHAKSYAAVNTASALRKIKQRQEQIEREAEQAWRMAREIQADCGLPTPFPPTPQGQGERSSSGSGTGLGMQESLSGPLPASPLLSPAPPPEPGPLSAPPTERVHRGRQPQNAGAASSTGQAAEATAQVTPQPTPPPPPAAPQQVTPLPLLGQPPAQAPEQPRWAMPATDISAMASRILSAHQAPGAAPFAHPPPTENGAGVGRRDPGPEPYVDALGRPLGPVAMPELPNIKDDPPPLPNFQTSPWRAAAERPQAPRMNGVASAGSSPQLSAPYRGVGPPAQLGGTEPPTPQAPATPEAVTPPSQQDQPPTSARRVPTSQERNPNVGSRGDRGAERLGSRGGIGSAVEVVVASSVLGSEATGGPASTPEPAGNAAPSSSISSSVGVRASGSRSRRESPARSAAANAAATAGGAPRRRTSEDAGGGGGASSSSSSQQQPQPQPQQQPQQQQQQPRPSAAARAQSATPSGSGSASVQGVSEELQAELEECLDTIRWCANSVTRESLQDMKAIQKPAPIVKDVLETVALVLGQPESNWDKLKRFFSSETFIQRIQKLNFQQSVTREQFRKLKEKLGHADFDEELIKTVCVPVVPLAIWCRAIGVYLSKTKYRGGADIRPVAGAGASSNPIMTRAASGGAPADGSLTFEPDLLSLGADELRRVRDLTIAKPGVGTITFHGETDCTGLDFSRIVRLEIGEVLVYPEAQLKPPVGTGLNKPATVTMFQCWPPNGSKLLQDPKSQDRYKKKIKQMTEDKHARFIDYDCNTGVWKFAVDHF